MIIDCLKLLLGSGMLDQLNSFPAHNEKVLFRE
jgi:hypothetical protein